MTELLFRDDAYLKTATARVVAMKDGTVTLDRTIFYPLGGGQPGDTGFIIRDNGERIAIADTRKGAEPGTVAHVLAAGAAAPGAGEPVGLEIDWERRYALMRLHTRAARDVLRRHRAGDRRQHRARQGATGLRHRHHAARRRAASRTAPTR